jgi:hypothetical protein
MPHAVDLSRLTLLLWRYVPGGYDEVSFIQQTRSDTYGVAPARLYSVRRVGHAAYPIKSAETRLLNFCFFI